MLRPNKIQKRPDWMRSLFLVTGLFVLLPLVLQTGIHVAHAQTEGGGILDAAKQKAIQLIEEKGPLAITRIKDRYVQVQSDRLIWLGLILLFLLPLIGFIGCALFPLFTKKRINRRLPNPPMGRLYKLHFIQAFVIGLVLFALGFCLWLVQFWVSSLGAVTNPEIALQQEAVNYVVEHRVELVENYTEVFVGVAEDLGEDPELALLSVIMNNAQQLRHDPLLNFSISVVNTAWPLMGNLFLISFGLVLLFFLRRLWPELKQMLFYPLEVVVAEREGRPTPAFNLAKTEMRASSKNPAPQHQMYNMPPQGYAPQLQNYNMSPQQGYAPQPQNYNPPQPSNYNMPPQPYAPQPQNYNMPPQPQNYNQQGQGYPPQPQNYSMPLQPGYAPQPQSYNMPQGQPQNYGMPPQPGYGYNVPPMPAPVAAKPPRSAAGVMWVTGGRLIWNEVRSIFIFAILTFILAIIMGLFLSAFFGPVIKLMVEVTSVAMVYFLRLDGASSIIVATTFLILIFLVECVVLFLMAFVFLLGKVLDGLRQHFVGNFTWKQTGRFVGRNLLRFAWVCVLASILGIGLSIGAEKAVEALLSNDNPNWFLSLVSAPIILLIGLNLGFWLLRGFKTLRRMFRNTDSLDIIAAAGSVVGGGR